VDGIPPELIFVLIFIVFSVLEGVGRKAKQQAKKREGAGRIPAPPPDRSPKEPPRETAQKGSDGSEGLIPSEVWEEILGLARGSAPSPKPQPAPDSESEARSLEDLRARPIPEAYRRGDETLEEIPEFEARSLEPLEPRPEPDRRVPDRSRKPAAAVEKARSRARDTGVAPPLAVSSSPRRSTGHPRTDLFGDGSPEELRKAIILREVLGPPLGTRE
jgi:hypothetical protein